MMDVTTNAPLDEVRGLVDERGRYEGWLSALDARKAVTPSHVLERVRQDYDGRLRRVLDALAAHTGALRADEAALAARHDDQLRALADRRDAMAEVELRTLVGEFPPEEGERQRHAVEGEIAQLEGTVATAAASLADVRGLLGRVARDATPTPATSEPAVTPDAPPAAVGATAAAAIATAPPDAQFDAGAFDAPADDRLGLDAARAALGDADVRGYAPNQYAPGIRSAGGGARSTPPFAGQGFADTAFRAPFGAGAPGGTTGGDAAAAAPPPPSAGTSGSTQEKTLRCPDCGAMNYPTEWYCEKCGGELAAL